MAVTNGTVFSVQTLKSDYISSSASVQLAEILFTMSGTYAQANNSLLASVNLAVQNSRRNGKTVTIVGVAPSQFASNDTDRTKYLGMKTVAFTANGANWDVTFKLTDNSLSTEFADATAITAQDRPFAIVVAFTEA